MAPTTLPSVAAWQACVSRSQAMEAIRHASLGGLALKRRSPIRLPVRCDRSERYLPHQRGHLVNRGALSLLTYSTG